MKDDGTLRVAETGAIRDTDKGKIRYVGAISPVVLQGYGGYIEGHSWLKDGTRRDNKNWQKLFGTFEEHMQVCMESKTRHAIDVALIHDGYLKLSRPYLENGTTDEIEAELEALYGEMFNVQAMIFALIQKQLLEKETGDKK